MKYRHRAVEPFWKHFFRLTASQEDAAQRALPIFKQNPFDPRLPPHKIRRRSTQYGRTIFAVDIEVDLRAVFNIEADLVVTEDIGAHNIDGR